MWNKWFNDSNSVWYILEKKNKTVESWLQTTALTALLSVTAIGIWYERLIFYLIMSTVIRILDIKRIKCHVAINGSVTINDSETDVCLENEVKLYWIREGCCLILTG